VERKFIYDDRSQDQGLHVNRRLLRDEGGFTLPELLVTMVMMIVVLFALYSIFDMSMRVYSFGNDKTEAVENARLGLEKLERETRAAYPQDNTSNPVNSTLFTSWTASSITFGNDLNGNWKIECVSGGPCETISYAVYQPAGSSTYTLGRSNTYGGTLQPVSEFVDYRSATDTGLKFRYFTKDGAEIFPGGDESKIARVRIELRVQVKRGIQPGTQTLTTDVSLRNRGN
jgi:type II secretory pathway component PulJ